MRSHRAAFSLVELLVSIAIISWASATTARIRQRRGSPIAEGSTGPPAGTVGAVVAVVAPGGTLEVGRDDVGTLTPCTRAPQCPIGDERRTAGREHSDSQRRSPDVVYFGGTHGCLLDCVAWMALLPQKEDLDWSSFW